MPEFYRPLVRPLLFSLPAELAHQLAEFALGIEPLWRVLPGASTPDDARLRTQWCGIEISNPVGLAAGGDKYCRRLRSLGHWGFGYMVAGTVTLDARPGNRKPRYFWNLAEESQTNAFGFSGRGLQVAARELARARDRTRGVPVAVSISGTVVDDMAECHRTLEPLVEAIEVNISSPNTAGLRAFHETAALAELLDRLNDGRAKPLMVKLPPYPEQDGPEAESVLSLARVCRDAGVDGLTAANSRPTKDPRLAVGRGGLSGRPIYERMLDLVRDLRGEVGSGIGINACGGIFTGHHAQEALDAGADTVQVHTAIVYRGPSTVRSMKAEILEQREYARDLAAQNRSVARSMKAEMLEQREQARDLAAQNRSVARSIKAEMLDLRGRPISGPARRGAGRR